MIINVIINNTLKQHHLSPQDGRAWLLWEDFSRLLQYGTGYDLNKYAHFKGPDARNIFRTCSLV